MAQLLYGAPVAQALIATGKDKVKNLQAHGIVPTLAVVKVGDDTSAESYIKGAQKRADQAGVDVRLVHLPQATTQDTLNSTLAALSNDDHVHGILLLQPLPQHLNSSEAQTYIAPVKDVDGVTPGALYGVFAGTDLGFAPCTAEAVVRLLEFYDVPLAGAHVVVLGRSLVVGRPASLLLQHKHATVTMCHSKTKELPLLCRRANIIVCCAGQKHMLNADYVTAGQTVIDVGIHYDKDTHTLTGDVDQRTVEPLVDALSPVPGGIGTLTSTLLVQHTILSAERIHNSHDA